MFKPILGGKAQIPCFYMEKNYAVEKKSWPRF